MKFLSLREYGIFLYQYVNMRFYCVYDISNFLSYNKLHSIKHPKNKATTPISINIDLLSPLSYLFSGIEWCQCGNTALYDRSFRIMPTADGVSFNSRVKCVFRNLLQK